MAKYCPIMSYHYQDSSRKQCLGKECAWADKEGNCLIAKALTQITDPISCLVPGYPNTNTPIDYPYRPIKLKMQGEIETDGN